MQIARSDFDVYKSLILSGQIEQHEAVKLLNDNPAFKAWYLAQINPVANTHWSAQFGSNDQ